MFAIQIWKKILVDPSQHVANKRITANIKSFKKPRGPNRTAYCLGHSVTPAPEGRGAVGGGAGKAMRMLRG